MSVQAKRRTSSQKKRRRSHHAAVPVNLSPCAECGALGMSHRVCPQCGTYKKVPGKKRTPRAADAAKK